MHIINMNLMDVYSKMINQKLEPTFPYDNEDLESNLENKSISFEKNITLNKIFKEKDIYSPKILKGILLNSSYFIICFNYFKNFFVFSKSI